MKKFLRVISLILCIVAVLSFAACKKQDNSASTQHGSYEQETEKGNIKDTVKLVLPVEAIEEEYRNDLDAYCEKFGYDSAKLNKKNGTVTLKMPQFSYELLLKNIGMDVLKSINEVASSGKYPCVKAVSDIKTDDFSKVTILVNKKKYKKEGDTAPYIIGQSCLLYQLYAGNEEYLCNVTVVDNKTKQVIETKTYTNNDIDK